MKRILFLATVFSLAAVSCTKESIRGMGSVIEEERDVVDFSSISTNGATNVYITKGNNFKVTVKAYENLVPYLETIVSNGNLKIQYRDNTNVRNDNSEVIITMPSIGSVNINGSADVSATGNFSGNSLRTNISGSGNIHFNEGTYNELIHFCSGSGNLSAFGVTVNDAEISVSGSGDAQTTCTGSLNVNISGSGTIYYKGNPQNVNSNVSGSGKLIKQ